MPHSFPYRHQPWKGLYLTYQLVTTVFLRLPYWFVVSTPSSWRPRRAWGLRKSVIFYAIRHGFHIENVTGNFVNVPNHEAIIPGEGVNGVWVEPSNHLITGELKTWADKVNATSIRIPGYWMHKEGSSIAVEARPVPGEKVIYMLHGGGFIRMSANPKDPSAAIPKGLVQHIEPVSRAFVVEYRLAYAEPFEPANPFPTQLLDAVAGYSYLVNTIGFDPNDIIIAGDSAGGTLAHALTQYLVDYRDTKDIKLPYPPGGLLLISPWFDLSDSMYQAEIGSHVTNLKSDIVGPQDGIIAYAKAAYLGPHGPSAAENNPYISPACLFPSMKVDLKNFPRTFISAGGSEVFLDSIKVYRDRMVEELGEGDGMKEGEGKVCYHEMAEGMHDYIAFSWCEPERTTTLKEIDRWVRAASPSSDV